MDDTQHTRTNMWIYMLIGLIVLVTAYVLYSFFLKENYQMIVETACDPQIELCFYRDCAIDECPPNGFTYYSKRYIDAFNFDQCAQEECSTLCLSNSQLCTKIECQPSVDVCSEIHK